MKLLAMRTAGKFLGAWIAIVSFVGLVSLTFTVIGTLACAVLVGMMMGAFKGGKWFSVLVSLVFPAVIFVMTRSHGAGLTTHQIHVLEGVCFAAFWVVYLVSTFLFFSEQKDRKSSAALAHTAQAKPTAEDGLAASSETLGAAGSQESVCLEQLQGNWVCEAPNAGNSPVRKVLEIKEAHLELRAVDVTGQMTLLAQGEVTLQGLRPS